MGDLHDSLHARDASDALAAHSGPAPLTADDDGEDFVVEVSSLVAAPVQFWSHLTSGSWLPAYVAAVVRMWARLANSPLWGRLVSSSWVPSWLPASIAATRRMWNRLVKLWLPAFAAATIRVWRRLMSDSWTLAYMVLAARVWCLVALSSLRVWGRLMLSPWMAVYAAVPVRVWDYRLTLREKLRRGVVIAASLLVALAIIFGPGIASGIATSRSAAAPAVHIAGPAAANTSDASQLGAWQSVPVPIAYNKPIAYTPAPDDPSTIYACGAGSSLHDSGFVPGNLLVWRTRDAGATWQALSLPWFLANLCDLRIAVTAPSRLALLATTKGCQSYVAYVTDDGGDHWNAITLPYAPDALPGLRECDLIATARHLYLWYSYGVESRAPNDRSVLLRSDNDGRSWKLASPGAPSTSFCNVAISTPSRAGDDDLLASCPSAADSGSSPVLRQSTDAGQHWRTLGTIPASGASILFTPAPSTQLGQLASTPLYAAYALTGNGGPSGLRLIQTLDGQHWQPLPPLPVPGTSPGLLGVRSILGTTADGRLFVLGVDPSVGATPSSLSSSAAASAVPADRWVWIWDPSSSHWSVMPSALPELASFTCPDICWLAQVSWGAAAGGTRLGPYIWAGSLPYNGNVLLRVFLPDLLSARVTRIRGSGSMR